MTDLGIIPKNSREEIRITAEIFKGHAIINIRVWYSDDSDEMRPGKQGLAFRLELLPAVLETLSKAVKGGVA
ncbi:transcriptional coactivator p15/PC4 family protein [Paracoccus litorisediminis]|uniref:Transcriptional Coactivator p15 (PC4) n=1 Tax=Paracoccus litorisediminis TaxID=2006130 RepID=A0A844HHH6_9RHOB|nr:transcriptional coactivator p15/PC4 family protein [Paracoccus litorisediminis]MTH57884.1 transcriptional Coactivator p15 (PC4) [Paracoccus litorisediminis]